jgi:hypothetical protein
MGGRLDDGQSVSDDTRRGAEGNQGGGRGLTGGPRRSATTMQETATGQLHKWIWAGVDAEAGRGENGPRRFSNLEFLFPIE